MSESELTPQQAEQIRLWTRRYAHNRMIALIVWLFVAVAIAGAIASTSRLTRSAWQQQNWGVVAACGSLLAVAVVALVWLCVRGGDAMRRLGDSYYGDDGSVSLALPVRGKPRRRVMWAGVIFVVCVQATVIGARWIPTHLLQPVSALYIVPFLWFLGRMNPNGYAILHWLWPGLYALHAVAILAGAPIVFEGKWETVNIYLPVTAYGLLTALAGHMYSRHALKRLREAAR